MTRDYCGNVIYRDGALERVQGDYGYMDSTGNYHYYIKDYQGNVRAVIDRSCEVDNPGVQPYKYGTKELDGERDKRTVPVSHLSKETK